jgi:hypothetical protein
MENIENKEDGAASARKVTLGIRIAPEHKHKLSLEAAELGISLSERSEYLLLCAESEIAIKNKAFSKALKLEKDLLDLKVLHAKMQATYENKVAKQVSEIENLNKSLAAVENQLTVFSEKRLLQLFEKLKGQKNIIETEDGERVEIIYDSTADVLKSMIYSFKLKKP